MKRPIRPPSQKRAYEAIDKERVFALLYMGAEDASPKWKPGLSRRYRAHKVAGSEVRLGYRVISIDGKRVLAHHVSWLLAHGEWPPIDKEVDHIDRNPRNNAPANLRLASRGQNQANRDPFGGRNNTSGRMGVSFHIRHKKWTAAIEVRGRVRNLGMYQKFEDAVMAREQAERELLEEFAPAYPSLSARPSHVPG